MKLRQVILSVFLLALPLLALLLAVGSANAMTAMGDNDMVSSRTWTEQPSSPQVDVGLLEGYQASEPLFADTALDQPAPNVLAHSALLAGASAERYEGQVVTNLANLSSPDALAITTGEPDALNASIAASEVFSITELKLTASDGAQEDFFGNSVSIDGNVALVGAPFDDDNGSDSGAAYIYRWDGSQWQEESKLLASDGASLDWFGDSVSIDGNVALVGAHGNDDNSERSGSAYIYRWDGSQWQEESKLLASDRASWDLFGVSVSIDGNVALVGAYLDDDNGYQSGAAYVYRWDGSQWQEESKLTASDGSSGDFFGRSVSISGNVALVGAYVDDDNGSTSGSAYIYRWDGSQWQEESKLLASDGAQDDHFGESVSIDGNVALVAAAGDDDNGSGSGSAYIYRWDGSQWQEESKLLASDGASLHLFGDSVSIDGNLALVGARYDDDNGFGSGSAYIYRWDGSQWQEESKLLASDGVSDHYFGLSVSIDGNVAFVGARYDGDNGYRSGAAYVYDLSSLANGPDITVSQASISVTLDEGQSSSETLVISNTGASDLDWQVSGSAAWLSVAPTSGAVVPAGSASVSVDIDASGLSAGTYTDTLTITSNDPDEPSVEVPVSLVVGSQSITELKLTASDGTDMNNFGLSVSIDGNVAIVGAPRKDVRGAAYIYRWDGSQWQEEGKLFASDGDSFGISVSIDGDLALVGSSYNDGNDSRSGAAYIYRWNGSQWQEEAKLLASDGASLDEFGHSVSIEGNLALVGAYKHGNSSGLAYIYHWDGSQWVEEAKLAATDGTESDRFGYSVSIDGNVALVGAYQDDDNGTDSGSAYVYDLSSLANGPDIALSPASISVTLDEGQSSSETLLISNTGTADLQWSMSSDKAGLTAAPTAGTVAADGSQSVSININATNLTAGSHSGTLTITSNDPDEPSILVPVTLTVNSSSAPTLELGKMGSAASAQPGDTLTYTIVVTATGGTSQATLIDQLPTGLSYVANTVTGGATYESASRQIRYTGSVTPGTPLLITYQATVDSNMAPGTVLYNAAELTSGETRLDAAAAVGIPDNSVNQTLVLLYVNGDNDLSEYMLNLVNRAEQAAGNEHLTVLLLLDGPGEGDTYLYRLEEDFDGSCPNYSDPTCGGRYEMGQNLWQWRENIASPYSLSEFLIGAQRAYPQANQIILSLVGHGGGWAPTTPGAQPGKRHGVQPGGLLWDDHFESSLSTAELGQALKWFQQATGRKIDLLYLDACLMGMSEVAYEVRESVDYLLASESWSWTSFSYDAHLNAINASTTAREIGEAWLDNEAHVLRPDDYPFTYSLIDLSQMTALRQAQDSLGNALSATLPGDKEKIDEAFRNSACFDSDNNGSIVQTGSTELDNYCDLYSFAQQIETQFNGLSAVVNAAQEVQHAISTAVVAKEHHNGIPWQYSDEEWSWEELGGLSIYLPLIEDKWARAYYNARHLQMAKDGQWDEFLTNAYWNNVEPPNAPACPNGHCEPRGPWAIAPISIQASAGQDSINVELNLQGSLSGILDRYILYRSVNGGSYINVTSDMDSQYSDNNLTPRSEYCYYVQALDRDDKVIGLSNVACVEFGRLQLWIPNEVLSRNDRGVLVPINLENGNGLCIGAMQVVISYDSTIATATGEVKSTIYSQGYDFEIRTSEAGKINIELSTSQCQELYGAGKLFAVGFDIIGSEGEVSTLDFISGLNGTVIYDDDDLYTPLDLALQHGSLKIGNTFIRGDINGDGVVNVADLVFSGRIANHKITPTAQQVTACDINGDQACTSADTTLIQCYRRSRNWNQCGGSESSHLVAREYDAQDEPAKVVIGTIGNSQSGRIRVPVRVTNAQNFAGSDLTFSYDAEQMSATGATLTSLTEAFELETNLAQPGLLHLSLASEDPIDADGTILMLEFTMTDEGSNRLLSDDGSSFNFGTVRLNDAAGRDFETSALQQEIEGSFCLADLNDDGEIDIVDVQAVSSRWNTEVGDSQYDPLYDLKGDGEIDIFDVQYVASRWNTACETTE